MTFPEQKTSFMKIYENLDTLVPFEIVKLVLMWAIFMGIQELLQKGFDCPCIHTSNLKYGVMFFIVPGVTFIMVSLLLLKCKVCCKKLCQPNICWQLVRNNICSWPGCKRLWQLVARVLFPGLMWVTVVLLDGDAAACIGTNSESQNLSDILCNFKTKKNMLTEQEQFVRYQLYVSQIAGLWLLLVMSFLALVIQLCKCCKLCEPCICWKEDLEQDYKEKDYKERVYIEKAQQQIEELAFSILLKKQKEEVTQKIEQALNNSRETYWAEIYNLCKDINLPTGDDAADPQPSTSGEPPETKNPPAALDATTGSWKDFFTCASCSCCCKGVTDSENSSASQRGTPGVRILDPASAGATGPVHRDEEQDNTASASKDTEPLLGGGQQLSDGTQEEGGEN